ncbi:hypothetical protein KUTeg_002420 [Tegillarca granosa]|uniref:Uncharacterized protein n=1 Tax=Tegillarca granosa TaxID=220873 RepID=A0ABQ9FYS5_TEGGR|nr:hypothetical protein KUTeg_002420 [Tegillarca granosa]
MKEKKVLMPEKENSYYDKLNPGKPLQELVIHSNDANTEEHPVPVTMVTADVHQAPPVSEHLLKKRTSEALTNIPENQVVDWDKPLKEAKERIFASQADSRNIEELSREQLARSIAEVIVGNLWIL